MALITIATKSTLDALTAEEFNQLLNALKNGTLEINPAGIYIAGTQITAPATRINLLADDGAKGNALLGRNGSGVIMNIQEINADPNISGPIAFQNMPFWVKKEIKYDDSSPVTILSIAEDYVVHHAIVKVEEAWDDGSKAFEVGYAADHDAFITDLGAGLATPKFYGIDNTFWGARIYNSTDKHQKLWVADGSYTLQATFVGAGNGGTQGLCTVYMMISRLH